MESVWLVTTGDYSSYVVHSVWAMREEATTYAARLANANPVKEYPVRAGLPHPVSYYEMFGRWPEEGDPYRGRRGQEPVEHQGWDDDDNFLRSVVPIASSDIDVYPGVISYIDLRVWGQDLLRVRKVFSEKWAQIKADFDVLVEAKRRERIVRAAGFPESAER